jgi:alcohol dehydrogenase (NADP+)
MAGEGTGGGGEGSGSYSVQLSTGRSMPLLGIGTARLKAEGAVTAVLEALRAGYRHIDGAKVYGNEAFVGAAIAKAVSEGVVRRSELFVTSKCWNDDHRPEHVRRACLRSLQDLQLEYLDLYLVHWPLAWRKGTLGCTDGGACLLGTWRAMEALVNDGLVRSIGVSNFGTQALGQVRGGCPAGMHRISSRAIPASSCVVGRGLITCALALRASAPQLLSGCRIQPACNQIERHPMHAQQALVRWCHEKHIRCVAWSPLAKYGAAISRHPLLLAVAERHGVSVPVVMLRWQLQKGVPPSPRHNYHDQSSG